MSGDSVLKKSQHPVVIDSVEERLDVCIEHPVHPFPLKPHPQGVQRLMLVAPRAKPIGEAEEVGLVDRRQHRAYFSDRGRPNQSDRGRCFSVIVNGLGRRASPGLNVAQSSTISLKRSVAAPVLGPVFGFD